MCHNILPLTGKRPPPPRGVFGVWPGGGGGGFWPRCNLYRLTWKSDNLFKGPLLPRALGTIFDWGCWLLTSKNKNKKVLMHLQAGVLQGCYSFSADKQKEKVLTYKEGCCTGPHIKVTAFRHNFQAFWGLINNSRGCCSTPAPPAPRGVLLPCIIYASQRLVERHCRGWWLHCLTRWKINNNRKPVYHPGPPHHDIKYQITRKKTIADLVGCTCIYLAMTKTFTHYQVQ